MEEPSGDKFAFARYNRGGLTNGNSASAALNKWLKTFVDKGCTIHSLRHSFSFIVNTFLHEKIYKTSLLMFPANLSVVVPSDLHIHLVLVSENFGCD